MAMNMPLRYSAGNIEPVQKRMPFGAMCAPSLCTRQSVAAVQGRISLIYRCMANVQSAAGLGEGVCRHRLGRHLQRLCIPGISAANQVRPTIDPALYPSGDLPTPPGGTPPRENWYSPPAQIGDNLYFLGTRNHTTYALVARNGDIILLDGNFEYATVDEIHRGLQFLGLDPSKVQIPNHFARPWRP